MRKRYPTVALLSWISPFRKAFPLKLVSSHIDRIVLWSSVQQQFALNRLKIPREKVAFVCRRVDHKFWRPMKMETDMICSAGQEMRDYPTLIEAMKGLDIRCHIAGGALTEVPQKTVKAIYKYGDLPTNITVGEVTRVDLRMLYMRSRFVVVPLLHTNTDNGVTAIEEAMAMGKAVICSRTEGQVDLIKEGKTGIFVPIGDSEAMRAAILYLWNNPEVAEKMGREGRKYIATYHTLDQFVNSVKEVVDTVIQEYQWNKKGNMQE